MAKSMYATIGSTTNKIKKNYAVIDNTTRKIKKVYAVIDGITRLVFSGSGNGIPLAGVVHPYANSTAYKIGINHTLWNGASFSNTNTLTTAEWGNITNANYYTSFCVSKNGRTIVLFNMPFLNNYMQIYTWDDDSETYVQVSHIEADPNNANYNCCYLPYVFAGAYSSGNIIASKSIYISNEGTQLVIPCYHQYDVNSNSPYIDLFDNVGGGLGYGHLLFYDINLDEKTVSFTKGVRIQGIHGESNSTTSGGVSNSRCGFTETDNKLLFVSSWKDTDGENARIYNINLSSKTVSSYSSYGADLILALSNNGNYAVYNSNDETYGAYLDGQYWTYHTFDFPYVSDTNNNCQRLFFSDDNPNVMYYCSNSNYIYCYSVNGTTVTQLGSIALSNNYSDTSCFYSPSLKAINDIHGNYILLTGEIAKNKTAMTTYTSVGLAQFAKNDMGLITSLEIIKNLGEAYNANCGCYNLAKFVNKTEIV